MSSPPESAFGVEASIQEAIERGDFENLKGRGRPLNLDDYFEAPEDRRIGYSILKASGFRPEEVELLREIAALETKLRDEPDEVERWRVGKALQDKRLDYNLLLERSRHRRRS